MKNTQLGTQNGDVLYGGASNDLLLGHQGDDVFDLTQSTGQDVINGQGGLDSAIFSGRFEDYSLIFKDTGNLRTFVSGDGLTADLKNVETLYFDNATYDVQTHTAQITTVSISDAASVREGDADAALAFTLNRTGDLSHDLSVHYTIGGTATAGADYTTPVAYTVHFDAGSATAQLSLAVTDDHSVESPESVTVQLVADTHYDFAPGAQTTASGMILDNDTLPLLHVSNASAVEGQNLVFHVSVDAPVDHDITFSAFTDTGTHTVPGNSNPIFFGNATAGNAPTGGDYDGFPPTTYTIHSGETSVDVSVHARTDLLTEGDETMSLRIQNATGATIEPGIGTGRGIGTIIDNPPQPVTITHVSFYADPNDATEGNDLPFHFHRDITTTAQDVKYWMGTFPLGGATPGVDFTADSVNFTFVAGNPSSNDFKLQNDHWDDPSMTVHFNAGQADANLVFHTINDGVAEGPEAFTVQYDFSANGPNVQFDGAASTAAYHAAGATDLTQVNIGHIVDAPLV